MLFSAAFLSCASPRYWTLQQGNGGVAGGGTVATVLLYFRGGSVGIGWTYSDVFPEHSIELSFWLAAIVFGVWPAWRFIRATGASHQRDNGLCPRCGYDLRASPDRCPECGTSVN